MSQIEMKAIQPQLEAYTITSESISGSASVQEVVDLVGRYIKNNSLVILRTVYDVKWGYYKGGNFYFSDSTTVVDVNYLQEIRIFNITEELRITLVDSNLLYRYIYDCAGKECLCVDSSSRLIGENDASVVNAAGFTILVDRGRKLSQMIPIETTERYCYLLTRNYIHYLENHQASFEDYRYVAIVDKEV